MNRQQQDLTRALQHVQQLLAQPDLTKRIYGGLCHSFPVLIRTNGLCQTLAFFYEKQSEDGERGAAYRAFWRHVAETLGVAGENLLNHVREASSARYLHDTQRLMEAWIYYKRFATSVLGVQPEDRERT